MRAGLRDCLEPLFADSRPGPGEAQSLRLDAAKGGRLAVHILLAGLKPGARVRFSCSKPGARRFRLIDVPVEANTGLDGFIERGKPNPHVVRRAPFRVYDAMQPLGSSFPASGPCMALRLELPAAKAGRSRVALRLEHDGSRVDLSLDANIHPAGVPPPGKGSFPYTNWFDLRAMATRHGLRPWSAGHWRMIRRYAKLMAAARQNTFWIPLSQIFDRKQGRLALNRARLRRLVSVFSKAGLYYIEGGHWGARTAGDWNSKTLSVAVNGPLVLSEAGAADIAWGGAQLMDEIRRHGWEKRWLQHAQDEPTPQLALEYRALVGMIRKAMPGIRILDATMNLGLSGGPDDWCPQGQEYQKHRAAFEAKRAFGDRIWFYTCCFPGGPWLNRLLDQELLRPALMGWFAARFGLDGFLHWGLNHYKSFQDPFRQSVVDHGGSNCLPAGDTHVVYPGKGGPWGSLRLEATREGFEDYELLMRLGTAARRRLSAKVLTRFDRYTKDVDVYRAARRELFRLAGRR